MKLLRTVITACMLVGAPTSLAARVQSAQATYPGTTDGRLGFAMATDPQHRASRARSPESSSGWARDPTACTDRRRVDPWGPLQSTPHASPFVA